jgi:hypothetical protein
MVCAVEVIMRRYLLILALSACSPEGATGPGVSPLMPFIWTVNGQSMQTVLDGWYDPNLSYRCTTLVHNWCELPLASPGFMDSSCTQAAYYGPAPKRLVGIPLPGGMPPDLGAPLDLGAAGSAPKVGVFRTDSTMMTFYTAGCAPTSGYLAAMPSDLTTAEQSNGTTAEHADGGTGFVGIAVTVTGVPDVQVD